MVTNEKIERKKEEIIKTATALAEMKDKLRQKKHELIALENDEIVAMFRQKIITEDDLAALMRLRQEDDDYDDELTQRKEDETDAIKI